MIVLYRERKAVILSGRKIILNLVLIVIGLAIDYVLGELSLPAWVEPYLGWQTLVILIIFLLVVGNALDSSASGSANSPELAPDENEPDPLVLYLQKLMKQVRDLNLSGIDRSLLTDPKRRSLLLSAVYVDLECQQGGEPLSVVEVMDGEKNLVLLGDPGAGKTTFVDFVALCMAGHELNEEANLGLLGDKWRQGWFLPVRVVLRDFVVQGLPSIGQEASHWDLWRYLEAEVGKDFAPHLREYLEGERDRGVIILLDGFDEVPEANERRQQVMDVVQGFVERYAGCRFLLTSRVYAWKRQDWQLAGFAEARLAPFNEGQIEKFVEQWYKELSERRREMSPLQATERAKQLKQAILRNERLKKLAGRPLLLTLMTSLHAWRGGDLPQRREKLYDRAVELLLQIWEGHRVVYDPDSQERESTQAIHDLLKADSEKLLKALEEVAYEVHAGQFTLSGTADIPERTLAEALWRIRGDQTIYPDQIIRHLQERSGLLLQSGVKVYKFPHRSFQEYLAARYLSGKEPAEAAVLMLQEPERWQEVVLLAIAKIRETPPYVWQWVHALAPDLPPNEPQQPEPNVAHAAYVAAMGVIENDLYTDVPQTHEDKVQRLRCWLVVILEKGLLPARQRALAAHALACLADPRSDIMTLPPLLTSPILSTTGVSFEAGIYPVTNAQFNQFIEAGGYDLNRNWWRGEGCRWLQNPPDYRGEVKQPRFWGQSDLNDANQPVVGVSYYEAEAFCGWLSHKYGREYRLPTEEEWLLLAQGTGRREYPWGNEWRDDAANTSESGINKPSAVGIFPEGVTPTGAHDCAGNIYDWCASWYDSQQTRRVLRGGYWGSTQEEVRCSSSRYWSNPNDCNDRIGFRVVSG